MDLILKIIKRLLLLIVYSIIGVIGLTVLFIVTYFFQNTRMNVEWQFRNSGKMYPTNSVEELYDKMPDGGTLHHTEHIKEGDEDIIYELNFKVDPYRRIMEGKLVKERFSKEIDRFKIEKEVDVAYSDEKGIYATDGSDLDDRVKNMKFLFLYLSLGKKDLRGYKANLQAYDSTNFRRTRIVYTIKNSELAKYMNVDEDKDIFLELSRRLDINGSMKFYGQVNVSAGDENNHVSISESIKEDIKEN